MPLCCLATHSAIFSLPPGKRGEWLFGAQALLLLGIVFPPSSLDSLSNIAGVAGLVGGGAYVVGGLRDLGGSLSPFPTPSKGNELVTGGAYAISRHPMYAGLLLGALGLDLLTASPTRFGITLVLNWLLHVKMYNEEQALLDLYGEEYERYQVCPQRTIFFARSSHHTSLADGHSSPLPARAAAHPAAARRGGPSRRHGGCQGCDGRRRGAARQGSSGGGG